MGINGLTTYLRENTRALSNQIACGSSIGSSSIAIVVDGWSFIYELYNNSGFSWVYGGEYQEFSSLVAAVIRALTKVGIKLFFVFDGPYPLLKFPTLVSRVSEGVIQPSLLFFRTSKVSRSTSRFLNESRILPSLCYSACVEALQEIVQTNDAVEVHFADQEGDPFSVELAGRVGAYVLGNDSDFVVLNSEGYLGYIPMNEMVWTSTSLEEEGPEDEENGEFQTVRSSKTSKKSKGTAKGTVGLIPPDDSADLSVTFAAYKPSTLAAHLHVPVNLLPLLGALVGNDYNRVSSNKKDYHSMFFDRRLSVSGRIAHVATTMQSILSAASSPRKRKSKHHLNNAMDLIDATVSALISRGTSILSSGEQEEIVEKIVEATLQYAIPRYEGNRPGRQGLWSSDVCALHEPTNCPLWEMIARPLPDDDLSKDDVDKNRKRASVSTLYINAYREGNLSPRLVDVIATRTCWPRIFLENPDLESTGRSIGKPIRTWCYAILDDGIGLPVQLDGINKDVSDDEDGDGDEDEDALIDVVEQQSDDEEQMAFEEDPLTPLQNALQKLETSESGSISGLAASTSSGARSAGNSGPKVVTEYVRRGTRLAAEDVAVPPIASLLSSVSRFETSLPVQLLPEETRLSILLEALRSDTSSVRALSNESIMAALAVRWVVHTMHARSVESGGVWDRSKHMWTRSEARAFLASFRWPSASDLQVDDAITEQETPPIEDRNVQLVAQVSTALESIEHLSQTLLLVHRVRSPVRLFSGKRFHSLLTSPGAELHVLLAEGLWDACMDGMEEAFAEDKGEKSKKDRKSKGKGTSSVVAGAKSSGGFFGMLADMPSDY